jgi:DNA-binding NtrC family response regulator
LVAFAEVGRSGVQDRVTERGGGAAEARKRGRVLIVDDEPLIGTTLRVLLGDEHDVVLAGSVTEAQGVLEVDDAFDAILCDLMMPRVSGMELYRWLIERDPQLASRMVFMTGGVFTDAAKEFLEGVDNARMQKPFDHDALLSVLRKLASS